MKPAWSVILFTTLAGVGQGLFLALFTVQSYALFGLLPAPDGHLFYAHGSLGALVLLAAGLVASFFHLGRPERAWRAAAMWRTSWLSREVIVLPGFIALAAAYALTHAWLRDESFVVGALASLAALVLFMCTGMIYACIRFLREWATALTPLNFTLLGCANGFTLAAALAGWLAPPQARFFLAGALGFTLAALLGRAAAWQRNARLLPKSTLQTAIGIKHPRIEQRSQGFMGGSFNTKEFFHGRSEATLRSLRWVALACGFALPLALLAAALASGAGAWALLAFALQYLGLLAERWLFFAEARHPQNLYYQRMA